MIKKRRKSSEEIQSEKGFSMITATIFLENEEISLIDCLLKGSYNKWSTVR